MLKSDHFFAVSARDGSMDPARFPGDGLWSDDTRILSVFQLLIDGASPHPGDTKSEGSSATFEQSAGALHITRVRIVDSGLHERITVTNRGTEPIKAGLRIDLASDGAAMLAVRGAVPQLRPTSSARPEPATWGHAISPRDSPELTTRILADPPGLAHHLELSPGAAFSMRLSIVPGSAASLIDFAGAEKRSKQVQEDWTAACMSVETDNSELNEALAQAVVDVRTLCSTYETGLYPTAGLPWFAVPFGRDALISSMLLLHVQPELARGVLRYLAAHQGRRVDPTSQEEPGRILHEVRQGEVVGRGYWPHILYGTIDATPLFLCAMGELARWTSDVRFLDGLWPAAEAALAWCRTYGDRDGDGYIECAHNQGWKDSHDSLTNVDGADVSRPAALCEVQAYLYGGLMYMARRDRSLEAQAAALKRRFNHDFWMPEDACFAQALDGRKDQVRAITSNAGHCLWMPITDPAVAAGVARRLVAPDMFSGWGVRTLSEKARNYDPCSYHNGSVWPFDSALAAAGLRRYRFARESEVVARAVLEAALEFPLRRPPELFCGDSRTPGEPPRQYWNTCAPQLWSAAALFSCVSSILGLEADAERATLRIDPTPTSLWNRIEVHGLHFGGERLDLAVEGGEVRLGRLPAGVRVESAPAAP